MNTVEAIVVLMVVAAAVLFGARRLYFTMCAGEKPEGGDGSGGCAGGCGSCGGSCRYGTVGLDPEGRVLRKEGS